MLTKLRLDLEAIGKARLEAFSWIRAQRRRVQTKTINIVLTANPITVITKFIPEAIIFRSKVSIFITLVFKNSKSTRPFIFLSLFPVLDLILHLEKQHVIKVPSWDKKIELEFYSVRINVSSSSSMKCVRKQEGILSEKKQISNWLFHCWSDWKKKIPSGKRRAHICLLGERRARKRSRKEIYGRLWDLIFNV